MSDDIVTRLRQAVCWCNDFDGRCHTCEAADEIELLRATALLMAETISSHPMWDHRSSEEMLQIYMEEARCG